MQGTAQENVMCVCFSLRPRLCTVFSQQTCVYYPGNIMYTTVRTVCSPTMMTTRPAATLPPPFRFYRDKRRNTSTGTLHTSSSASGEHRSNEVFAQESRAFCTETTNAQAQPNLTLPPQSRPKIFRIITGATTPQRQKLGGFLTSLSTVTSTSRRGQTITNTLSSSLASPNVDAKSRMLERKKSTPAGRAYVRVTFVPHLQSWKGRGIETPRLVFGCDKDQIQQQLLLCVSYATRPGY